jgi:hypothetical protein
MRSIRRVAWLVAGATWAALSMVDLAHPDYWDPITPLDWTAVWLFSVALVLFAPAVVLLGRLVPSRRVLKVALMVGIASIVAGVANAVEDGFGVGAWGTPYVIGFLTAWFGLLALAGAMRQARHTRLAAAVVGLTVGVALFPLGGGVIVLVAFGGLALAPRWFVEPDALPERAVIGPSIG